MAVLEHCDVDLVGLDVATVHDEQGNAGIAIMSQSSPYPIVTLSPFDAVGAAIAILAAAQQALREAAERDVKGRKR